MTSQEFHSIYKKLYMPLCMYSLRIAEDTDVANDVVQTTFMRVWEMLKDGHEVNSIERYLYRAVRNVTLETIRNSSRFSSLEEIEETEVGEDEIDTAERDARLWMAIDSMPARRREIFIMCKRDGLTYANVAEELSISVKTVENQMSKALSTLRATLRGDFRLLSTSFILTFL